MSISVHARPPAAIEDKRRVLVLDEERLGHYPEFRDFFAATFSLETTGLSCPGYVRGPSGYDYELIFVGRSGEVFPSGLEIHALVEALEPLDEAAVDSDLWALLRWVFAGVGGEWDVESLDATGRLYRIPPAMER